MKRTVTVAVIVLFGITSGFLVAFKRPPAFVVSAAELDLGFARPGDVLAGTFTLSTTASREVGFAIDGSCGCSDISPSQGIISPGESVEVTVRAQLPLAQMPLKKTVTVRVQATGGEFESRHLTVLFEVRPFLTVTPNPAQFGGVFGKSPRSITLHAQATDGRTLAPADLVVTSNSPFLRAELGQTVTAQGVPIELAILPGAPLGPFSSSVRIQEAGNQAEIQVPVFANIQNEISISPSRLFLAAPDSGSDKIEVLERKCVVWRVDGKAVGPLQEISGDAGANLQITDAGPLADGKRTIVIKWDPKSPAVGQPAKVQRVTLTFDSIPVQLEISVKH